MMRTLTLILGLVRLDNHSRNLEPNLWHMLPGMILRTARAQLWNHPLTFLLWIWVSRWRVTLTGKSLPSLQMVLRNQRPILTPWNQLLLVLPFLEKMFCRTQMTWWMIPLPSPYLMTTWVVQQMRRQLRLHLRGWTEELLNLHLQGNVKLN